MHNQLNNTDLMKIKVVALESTQRITYLTAYKMRKSEWVIQRNYELCTSEISLKCLKRKLKLNRIVYIITTDKHRLEQISKMNRKLNGKYNGALLKKV